MPLQKTILVAAFKMGCRVVIAERNLDAWGIEEKESGMIEVK